MSTARIICGDARDVLPTLPEASVQCCVTSPPYWRLRDYGHPKQIGLEKTPELYVAALVGVFREVRRVLRNDGTLWLNLGDGYADGGKGGGGRYMHERHDGAWLHHSKVNGLRNAPEALKHKDLLGIPWMVAFALRADGWYLRSEVIWHKTNCLPESCKDRPTRAHETLFLLSKKPRYFYDLDAIREPHADPRASKAGRGGKNAMRGQAELRPRGNAGDHGRYYNPLGRNKRSVWSLAVGGIDEAHYAVMPEALVEPCVLAGSRVGDLVLDPFGGSGTVGVVTLARARSFLGIELNDEYAQLARSRVHPDAPLFSRRAS